MKTLIVLFYMAVTAGCATTPMTPMERMTGVKPNPEVSRILELAVKGSALDQVGQGFGIGSNIESAQVRAKINADCDFFVGRGLPGPLTSREQSEGLSEEHQRMLGNTTTFYSSPDELGEVYAVVFLPKMSR